MNRYFVIADLHFGHNNIIKYCNRPFASVDEMNTELINNWNKTVGKDDTVFVCGDVALNKRLCKEIIPLLNGRKILIMGNHDQGSTQFYRDCGFAEVSRYPIVVKGFYIFSHAPLPMINTAPYFNYYGHVHNDPVYQDTENSKCISAERINYTPIEIFLDGGDDHILYYSTRQGE